MQAATQESTDAQYQQAMSLYAGQSHINKLQIGLVDTMRERSTNMLTGLLTGTQTFKDSMVGLFSSLTQSIVQSLIEMAAQALLTKTILSSFMSFGGGAAGAGNNPGAVPMFANAKGGVYSSPSLSAYSGQVVSQPTTFAFAKGAGLMGEAGPEAIMPLKRGADGSLGVRAMGLRSRQQQPRLCTSPSKAAVMSARRQIRAGKSLESRWATSPRRKARRSLTGILSPASLSGKQSRGCNGHSDIWFPSAG